MAAEGKKPRAKWNADVERQLIDIWADILEEVGRKMMTRRIKESIATARLNTYVTKELGGTKLFTEKAVCNKIDSLMKKGKGAYVKYQKKGEMGKEFTEEEAEFDREAAERAWPNFRTFYLRFKDHPSIGPGSVEDSAVGPSASVAREEVVATEQESATNTPDTSRSPSRLASIASNESESEEDEVAGPPKKTKKVETSLSRVGKKKGRGTSSAQFLAAFAEMQEQAQQRNIEHERKMQEEAMAFQVKIDQYRARFEADLATRLQQQSSQFEMNLMQTIQSFQAELLKRLFEKNDSN